MEYKQLIELLCRAIKQRTLLKIYYKSDRRSDWRIIRPYMIWQNPKENLSLAGGPIEELQNPSKDERTSGQYLLTAYNQTRRGANLSFTGKI